jgi:hypothetical protein
MWLLDFNQCSQIKPNYEGARKAVVAMRVNDPYYPRPQAISKAAHIVWRAFRSAYIATGSSILGDLQTPVAIGACSPCTLPTAVMMAWEHGDEVIQNSE